MSFVLNFVLFISDFMIADFLFFALDYLFFFFVKLGMGKFDFICLFNLLPTFTQELDIIVEIME